MQDGTSSDIPASEASVRIARLRRWMVERLREDGTYATSVPGLTLYRWSHTSSPHYGVYTPSLCVVVQGEKQVWLGRRVLVYNPATYLISSIHVPAQSRVSRATPTEPYLALRIEFQPQELVDMLHEDWARSLDGDVPEPGLQVACSDGPLVDAIARYVSLVDSPEDEPFLGPIWRREIFYRVLRGAGGARWARMLMAVGHADPVHRAVRYLAEHFRDPVRIEDLAAMVNMSPSTLHRHFKALTQMSPIQYQKRLRLLEARRLLVAGGLSVTEAALSVGYESVSQFTRDYARLFGLPPSKDADRSRLAP
ncbi:AraC family transcriptional regulator [Alicyclobacillus sendaiensis]|uniref:AraC family transcriptional regulator n=1 Tax=Alicyclobacillus sendaiensis TaxID=192387 RepID=UPI0026F47695|nr:AraC family transcriptional regulator [Alicyclobacillus sendaiensis]